MMIEGIDARPDPELADALERFETKFRYPLGHDEWFRISHCEDYTCFFRAIGRARCFVAMQGPEVVGVLSAMICRLRRPKGDFERVAYLSDLKVASPSGGRALLRIFREAMAWILTEPTPGFCVVMDGTATNPSRYTGRLEIPEFRVVGKLMVLRVLCESIGRQPELRADSSPISVAKAMHRELTEGRFATDGGDSSLRSQVAPIGLVEANGEACGVLEDTRRGKRLYDSHGNEMVSGHLSSFGYRHPSAAAAVIRAAVEQCHRVGFPALFTAVPLREAEVIVDHLPGAEVVKAPATVFGYALEATGEWSINTAEI